MSSKAKWIAAAKLYGDKSTVIEQPENPPPLRVLAPSQREMLIEDISKFLTEFEASEDGQAAKELLKASRSRVVIFRNGEKGFTSFYVLDCEGYKYTLEASGSLNPPRTTTATTEEIADMLVQTAGNPATALQVKTFLYKELDRIAEQAPQ